MEKNNKLNDYQQKFNNYKNELDTDKPLEQIVILEGELIFEIVKALQIILQQNTKNDKKISALTTKIAELIGDPIILMGENNGTDNGKDN